MICDNCGHGWSSHDDTGACEDCMCTRFDSTVTDEYEAAWRNADPEMKVWP